MIQRHKHRRYQMYLILNSRENHHKDYAEKKTVAKERNMASTDLKEVKDNTVKVRKGGYE